MAYLKSLLYNHFDPSKPTIRITYHSNGTKTERNLRTKTPNKQLASRFSRISGEMGERLEKGIGIKYSKGENDEYDWSRNKRKLEDAHKEE